MKKFPRIVSILVCLFSILFVISYVGAIEPISSNYLRFEDFAVGYPSKYTETRDQAWLKYQADPGEEVTISGTGYAGQIGIVDRDSMNWFNLYNTGFKYRAHYDLSGINLSNYTSANLVVGYQRPGTNFWKYTLFSSLIHTNVPITLDIQGVGTIPVAASEESGTFRIPIGLASQIDIEITSASLKTENPVPATAPAIDTTFDEFVLVDTAIELVSHSHDPPTASFTYSPANPPVYTPISFDGSSSTDSDGTIVMYTWNFGDGLSGSGQKVTHIYSIPGDYTVSLTITDDDGLQDTQTHQVPVTPLFCLNGYKLNETNSPLAGWTITLSNETFTVNTTTGADGSYYFCGLQPGTYNVSEHMQTGWFALSPANGDHLVTLSTSDVMNINFTNKQALVNFTFSPEKIRITDNVTFDASGSVNLTEEILFWEFGDGQTDLSGNSIVHHSYTNPGSYAVNLTVYYPGGSSSFCSKVVDITIPVILVHGWNAGPETWSALEGSLKSDGYQVFNFNYKEISSSTDPRIPSWTLKNDVRNYRKDLAYNGLEYKGKYDIVAHSMGALVTRYYIEELDGYPDVRQWIGVAPVNHGSATADFAQMVPDWVKSLINTALNLDSIFHLRTDSPVVTSLNNNDIRDYPLSNIKYRVIGGYNGAKDPYFLFSAFGGKTWEYYYDETGTKRYYLTWMGDGIVSQNGYVLEGAGIDYVSYDHLMTDKQLVIQKVKMYIQNISISSSNTTPWMPPPDLWWGVTRTDFTLKALTIPLLKILIGSHDMKALVRICWIGSDVNMTLISPSGERIGPDSDKVAEYLKTDTSIYYLLDNPEPGEWKAEIEPVDIPPEGEPVTFAMFVNSSLTMTVGTADNSSEYLMGTAPVIIASISNNSEPVTGAFVWVNVTFPDNTVQTLQLFDKGSYKDNLEDDGIYSVSLPLIQPGYYSLIVETNGSSSEPFQRTYELILHSIGNTITLISPNGGENWTQGSNQTLQWIYSGDPGSTVKIEAFRGSSVFATITSGYSIGSGGSGSFNLTFPYNTPPGYDYKIRVTSNDHLDCNDTSDAPFSIHPAITVLSPNGGENWHQGSSHPLRWTYTGNPGSMVKIEALRSGTVLATIASSYPIGSGGAGSFNLTFPSKTPPGDDYRIRVTSSSYPSCSDTSDGPFRISADENSSITVVTPNGGENWLQGSSHTLSWTYIGNPGSSVKIEAMRGETHLAVITPGTSIGSGGSGSYNLTFPYATPMGSDYHIRITSTSNPAYTDTSDSPFTIIPAINVVSPDGGEKYPIGSTLPMSWSYTGNPGSTVKIDVFKGTTLLKTLTGIPIGAGGSGSYKVTIPSSTPQGSDYTIRVTSESYAACNDTSNSSFEINASW